MALTFNGTFECEYPDEFLKDLDEVRKKHGVEFYGRIVTRDLGKYVDFQKQDDNPVEEEKHEQTS